VPSRHCLANLSRVTYLARVAAKMFSNDDVENNQKCKFVPYMSVVLGINRTQYVVTGKVGQFPELRFSLFGVRVNFGPTRTEVVRPSHADETCIETNKYKSVNRPEMCNIWPGFTSHSDRKEYRQTRYLTIGKMEIIQGS
jgi:hypothetical protein